MLSKTLHIENPSSHRVPVRCTVNLAEFPGGVPLRDLPLLDACVGRSGKKIRCKRTIADEATVHVLFSAEPRSAGDYTIDLFVNRGRAERYAPCVGAGDALCSTGRSASGPLHAGFASVPAAVPWFDAAGRDLLVSVGSDIAFRPAVLLYRYIGMRGGAPLYAEGIRLNYLEGMLRPIQRDDGLFDLLGLRRNPDGYALTHYRNTGGIGNPVFERCVLAHVDFTPLCRLGLEIKQFELLWRGGAQDMVLAVCDASGYNPGGALPRGGTGKYRPYNRRGRWLGGDLRGLLFTLTDVMNEGCGFTGEFVPAGSFDIDGVAGISATGEESLYLTDDIDGIYMAHMDGCARQYGALTGLYDPDGNIMRLESHFYRLCRVSYGRDDAGSLLAGCEDGFVYYLKNLRRMHHGRPVFAWPQKVCQQYPHITSGIGLSPVFARWRGTKKRQLMLGDAAGFVSCMHGFEGGNVSTECIVTDNGKFRRIAGLSGSLQGPAERTWGYLGVSAFDFDGDGYDDLVASDVKGNCTILVNGRSGLYASREADVCLRGTRLQTAWRCRAVYHSLGDGSLRFMALDEKGFLAEYDVPDATRPYALAGKRILRYVDGDPIKLDGSAGLSGRIKLELCNWSGTNDILFGTKEGQSQPFNPEDQSLLFVLTNTGTPDDPVYARPKPILGQDGTPLAFGAHDPSPLVCDIDGCGASELVVGGENGFIYVYATQENREIGEKIFLASTRQ